MPIRIKSIVKSEQVTKATHARIMRETLREEMTDHRDKTLPLHFVEGAENVYHMARRTAKYTREKFRKFGHRKPLVWSGRMRDDLRHARITATQYVSRMYCRSHIPLSPKRRQEVEIVLQREKARMNLNLRRRYKAKAALPENQRIRQRRS